MSAMMPLNSLDRLGGHHELVLQEARGSVSAVPLPEHVERVVELRQVLDLAAVGARLAVPQLADRHEGELVRQAVGKDIGKRKQLWRIEFQRVLCSFAGSWSSLASEPREIAARPSLGGALIASNQALEYV